MYCSKTLLAVYVYIYIYSGRESSTSCNFRKRANRKNTSKSRNIFISMTAGVQMLTTQPNKEFDLQCWEPDLNDEPIGVIIMIIIITWTLDIVNKCWSGHELIWFWHLSDVEFLPQVIKLNVFTSVRNECHVMVLSLFSLSSGLLHLWAVLRWHPIGPTVIWLTFLSSSHINQTPPSHTRALYSDHDCRWSLRPNPGKNLEIKLYH